MLAVSQFTKDKIVEYAQDILPPRSVEKLTESMRVLYPPFNNSYFLKRSEEELRLFREKFKVPEERRVISYFGRLFPERGVDDLLTAYAIIRREHPDTLLLIGGQGISSNDLKRDVQLHEIPGVIFTDTVSDSEKRALMQLSYVGVIPTKPVLNFIETLCITALEYQAAGVPLVTTRVGGVPEAAGRHSLYAKQGSPEDLAEQISLVLNNKVDRKAMIEAGIEHVKKFNYSTITRKFIEYLEEFQS